MKYSLLYIGSLTDDFGLWVVGINHEYCSPEWLTTKHQHDALLLMRRYITVFHISFRF